MKFKGKIVAETKVKSSEGMAIRITLDSGIYFELNSIQNIEIFNELHKMVELGKKLEIIIKED